MKKSPSGSRSLLLLIVLLGLVLIFLFRESFVPGKALFSNDGPLGVQLSRPYAMPGALFGNWSDLNWLGFYAGAYSPNFSGLSYLLSGPMGRVNFYAPISALVLGLCAWLFFRQIKCSSRVAILGALSAALNMNFFSNACWGLGSRGFSLAAAFLALAAIEAGITVQPILTSILAGLAIGLSITEGGDNGAIFSVFIAAYAFWRTIASSSNAGKAVALGVGKVIAMAAFAGILALPTIGIFVRTSVKGIVGLSQTEQSKQERWDFATQWSLPKLETLRVIIPGLFGYRMDTADGGNYWGRVGEAPSNPQAMPRYSGAGEYAGVIVVLIAIWGVVEALRKKAPIFTDVERKMILFWAVMAFIAMLLGWGRHAPFYRLVYMLPYFSTIRNPMKFFHVVHLCLMILFAYGLLGMNRRYLDAPAKSTSLFEQLKLWWSKGPAHERLWTWACIALFGISVIGWFGFIGSRADVVKHLMASGFADQEAATQIARFSAHEIFLYVVFLLASILLVTVIISGAVSGPRATVVVILLGAVLVLDLARANAPWIVYYDWHEKYDVAAAGKTIEERRSSNPIIALLNEKSVEHRVSVMPFAVNREMQILQQVYHVEWLQHHFPYYGIQAIDMPQEPRVPEDKQAYREALAKNITRMWQLTNTRYLLGLGGGFVDALNQQLDPTQKRFRNAASFNLTQTPNSQHISVETNANGPFALVEFTGALPRVKMYMNWEVIPEATNVLARLGDPSWDPTQTILISDNAAPKPTGGATNTSAGEATITANPNPKFMEVRTKAPAPAMLLLNDKIDPEWHAYVENKEVPIYRANFLVRAVQVPAGDHVVTFKYITKPTNFYLVAGCELFGFLLLGVVIISAKRKNANAEAR